jgi:hypothetical protein
MNSFVENITLSGDRFLSAVIGLWGCQPTDIYNPTTPRKNNQIEKHGLSCDRLSRLLDLAKI